MLTESNHPRRVEVHARQQRDADATTFYLNPEWKAPGMEETPATAVAETAESAGTPAVAEGGNPTAAAALPGGAIPSTSCTWQYTEDVSMRPFWGVRRLTQDDLAKRNQIGKESLAFNCEFKPLSICSTTVGAIDGESVSNTTTVVIPILKNSQGLKAGTELILEVEATQKEKKKTRDWESDAKAKESAAKKRAKAPPKAKAPAKGGCLEI